MCNYVFFYDLFFFTKKRIGNHITLPVRPLYLSVAASRALGGGPVRHAVARGGVEAEELCADAPVLEACAGPTILTALGIQGQELSGQHPG